MIGYPAARAVPAPAPPRPLPLPPIRVPSPWPFIAAAALVGLLWYLWQRWNAAPPPATASCGPAEYWAPIAVSPPWGDPNCSNLMVLWPGVNHFPTIAEVEAANNPPGKFPGYRSFTDVTPWVGPFSRGYSSHAVENPNWPAGPMGNAGSSGTIPVTRGSSDASAVGRNPAGTPAAPFPQPTPQELFSHSLVGSAVTLPGIFNPPGLTLPIRLLPSASVGAGRDILTDEITDRGPPRVAPGVTYPPNTAQGAIAASFAARGPVSAVAPAGEVKLRFNQIGLYIAIRMALTYVTEFQDLINALYKALPKKEQRCAGKGVYMCKMNQIVKNAEAYKNPGTATKAINNILTNEVEDQLIGRLNKGLADSALQQGMYWQFKALQWGTRAAAPKQSK